MEREEWLEMRRTKIGASDAAIILEISPWKTPYQLWKEKVFGSDEVFNGAMRRGMEMEPQAREAFENLTGLCVMPKVLIHPVRNWQMASLDGITFDGDVIVELKCPNKKVHAMAKEGKLPDYYMAQVQHQMSVAEVDMAYYFSFNGIDGALVEVKRDRSFLDKLLEKEFDFWTCVIDEWHPLHEALQINC